MTPNLPQLLRASTKRRTVTIDTGDPLKRDRDRLLKVYLQVIRHWEGARQRLVRAYERELANYTTADEINRRQVQVFGDSISDLQAEIDEESGFFTRIFATLTLQIEDWASVVEWWHRGRWRNSLLSASGVDLDTVLHAGDVDQTLQSVIRQNVELIKSVDAQQAERMTGAIFRGLNERKPARELAKELRAITQFGRRRALTIASDQIQKAATALDTERMYQAGITKWKWLHSGKVHYRPHHKARNGKLYYLKTRKAVDGDEVIPADDMPGIPIRCFPSWQPVGFNDDIFVAFRRWHSGHLTEIITETGETISATPNHPVLTRDGWRAIETLNIGDDIIHPSLGGIDAFDMDIIKMQPRAGDLFEACKAVSVTVSTNGLGGDFHGDATPDEEIEIVNIEGGLRNEIKSACNEGLAQFFLENAIPAFAKLASLGVGEPMPSGDRLSTASIVRRLDLLEALCWRQISPDDDTGIACTTEIYTTLFEAVRNAGTGYAEPVGQTLDTLAAFVGDDRGIAIKLLSITAYLRDMIAGPKVAPSVKVLGQTADAETSDGSGFTKSFAACDIRYDKIKSVITRAWSGHVHNLQTGCGWYMAGFAGVVNCGCRKVSYIELDGVDDNGDPV